MHLEEKLILGEIRKGNCEVYEALFNKHYDVLVNFANQFLNNAEASEDIVQGVFIYLWENKNAIQKEQSIKSYLFQSVKNDCLNYLRSLKIRDKHELLYLEALIITNDEEILSDITIVEEIKVALQQLPEQMYDIFWKKYFQDMPISEIAKELEVSPNTVKAQLFNGRKKVREFIKTTTGIYFFL
ncbi:RNA polymerase sigma-70 factor [Puteibacter caeruleilacunae]|nr:RNA polymerase sigma-70 factor [Puteibacter caeruleilacunae]